MLDSRSAALSFEQPGRSPFAIGAAPIYLFLIVSWGLMPLALTISGLRIASAEFGLVGGIFAFVLWFAWCLRGRGLARVATALEASTLFYALCVTFCLMTFVAGTSDRAFVDAPLAHADHLLLPWFNWPGAMRSFSASGLPVRIANRVYESINWQPQLLIAILSLAAAYGRVWHFLLSWIATLCIVVAIFAFYPVLGAYHHFGIAAADVPGMLDPTPWNQPALLEGLHRGTLRLISLGTLDGIVDYPSFHAGAAVLLTYGFWSIRTVRWPFAVLNALMLASAVPIGGHYVVDLLAGVVTAITGIIAAAWIVNRMPALGIPMPYSFRRRTAFSRSLHPAALP
ncbi:phosphatase PAP2 family protein [Hephaestia mangrovi]|uniref:phosphatase PAP2 family protein n=1 Tax=Hephaestia mangrovi TaxID=2873268 RepID=UPI001CA6F716|nr:phosphatase PAP2 family protein [Hephaestia mangrovi]MBY8827575.1 phosphatase PAP2 family protein [Hephaestia mangrovi]